MHRDIVVVVDKKSWGTKKPPTNFNSGVEQCGVGEVLLTIGLITAPPRASGFSLSEYWAWIRYACAISSEPRLSLVAEYKDIDAHQKTILSDDFGMGFSVYWMWKRMNFSFICDGRYFVDRYLNHFGGMAAARTPGKRGPTKCPDFVCWKPAGSFHVIECKGTQSGKALNTKQILTAQGQKTTINFPVTRRGEQIACGMMIEFEGCHRASTLFVAEPDYKSILDVDESRIEFAEDTMIRGLTSRVLGISGLPLTALAFAEPDIGAVASSRPRTSAKRRAEFSNIDETRRNRSEAELRDKKGRVLFQESGTRFSGQERILELPVAIDVGTRLSSRVMVRQGVNTDILDSLSPGSFRSFTKSGPSSAIEEATKQMKTESVGEMSTLSIGQLYRSEISFL
jgi:hypothetical protein